jgi:hypothetical protein
MVKLNKQRKKKKFNYARNRKRERKIQEKTTKFNVKVDCKTLKDNWDREKSLKQNMLNLGVAFDANAVVPIKTTKKRFLESNLETAEKVAAAAETERASAALEAGSSVVGQLEAEAAVVKPPTFRFSTEQVKWIREGIGSWEDIFFHLRNLYDTRIDFGNSITFFYPAESIRIPLIDTVAVLYVVCRVHYAFVYDYIQSKGCTAGVRCW